MGAIGFRSLVEASPGLKCSQADSTIPANRLHLWKCVRARVLISRHEEEIWMIRMKAFFSLVPFECRPQCRVERL